MLHNKVSCRSDSMGDAVETEAWVTGISFFKNTVNNLLFLAVLGLHCYVEAFTVSSKRGLLIAVASLVAKYRL